MKPAAFKPVAPVSFARFRVLTRISAQSEHFSTLKRSRWNSTAEDTCIHAAIAALKLAHPYEEVAYQ